MSIFTILFVCTGNTCRSPLAEGIAQKWLDDHDQDSWIAVSAGVYAAEGFSTSIGTIEALSQRGIVFQGISKLLTKEMVRSAHIVFCMNTTHLSIAKDYSDDSTRVELLDPEGPIVDPVGQEQTVYDELADKMDTLIAQRLRAIVQQSTRKN